MEPSQRVRDEAGRPKRPGNNEMRRLVSVAALGFLVGVVFMIVVALLLSAFGVLSFGAADCPQSKDVCPPTPAFLPACPTCEVQIQQVTAPPPTPTQTPTPDIEATATAACENFEAQFPGTPCPPLATATPTPTP